MVSRVGVKCRSHHESLVEGNASSGLGTGIKHYPELGAGAAVFHHSMHGQIVWLIVVDDGGVHRLGMSQVQVLLTTCWNLA